MSEQARGACAELRMDYEASYNTSKAVGSRLTKKLPYNTFDLVKTRPLNQSNTLTGDRNPTKPFPGPINASGSMVVPLDLVASGYWFRAMFGDPDTSFVSILTNHYAATGPPTCTITDGVFTSSSEQPLVEVGDRISYDETPTKFCYVLSITTPNTVFVVGDVNMLDNIGDESGGTAFSALASSVFKHDFTIPTSCNEALPSMVLERRSADLDLPQMDLYTGVKVNSMQIGVNADNDEFLLSLELIASDKTSSYDVMVGAPTITVDSGVATFTIAQTLAAEGDAVVYGSDKTLSYLETKNTTSEWVLKTQRGGAGVPGDVAALTTVAGIITDGYYDGNTVDAAAMDSISSDPFYMSQAVIQEGLTGALTDADDIKVITIDLANNLDDTSRTINSGGTIANLPEGVMTVGGSINALFKDDNLMKKAADSTEVSIDVTVTKTTSTEIVQFHFDELLFSQNSPPVTGPEGMLLDIDFIAYFEDGANDTAITISLTNDKFNYAL